VRCLLLAWSVGPASVNISVILLTPQLDESRNALSSPACGALSFDTDGSA